MENMFKHASSATIPVLETDNDYHKYKSRRNAWVTVDAGGFTLPKDEKTFDELYVRASGKPTVNLNSVEVSMKGDYGLLRSVKVQFTCFDRDTFLQAEKACLRPNREVSVQYGYVNPSYGGGGGDMEDLRVSAFNWTINDKNQYVCTFTAIGPTNVLAEFNIACQIKDTNLTFMQPRLFGKDKEVTVTSLSGLIEYDAQQSTGEPSEEVEDATWIRGDAGGTIGIFDEPRTGLFAKLVSWLPNWITKFLGQDKMLYVTLEYIVERLINDQILSQATKTMKGRFMAIAAEGYVVKGMCSSDPMNIMYLGDGDIGNYADPSNENLGKNWDPNGDGPQCYVGEALDSANILFNKDFVVDAFEEAKVQMEVEKKDAKTDGGKSGKNGVSLRVFFDQLFKKIEETSGGWWQFGLTESESDSKTLLIVNRNQGAGGINALQFDPINGDAVTRSTSIECSPSADDVYQAMCNQQKEATTPDEVSKAGGEEEEEEEPEVTHEEAIEILKKHRTETAPGGFDKGLVEEMTNAQNTLISTIPKPKLKENANIPYPMKLNITLDGTSGFRFGDLVTSTALPEALSTAAICFRVTEVVHTFDNNDWKTTLTTICDISAK